LLSQSAGRGAIYLYLQFLSSITVGYAFWIFITKFTTAETIGIFALVISLAEIFANIAILGIPDGIQRFLPKCFSEKRLADAKVLVKLCLVFLSIGVSASSIVILILGGWLVNVFGISFNLIVIIDLILASYAIYLVLYSIIIASLRTQVLPIIIILSSIVRIAVGVMAVMIGAGVWGLALGYTFLGHILSCVLLGGVIIKLLKIPNQDNKSSIDTRSASKNLLTASVVTWVPTLITTVGVELGTLVIFGTKGPGHSGVYFIIITLVSGINLILYSLYTIALPVLSTMVDGRKRLAWQTIRLSSIITVPFASSLIFYAKDIMELLGPSYVDGSTSFQILLLSVFPNTIAAGVDTLVYAYGHYRRSLAINISMNVTRVVLYFLLVPVYGVAGAAISYTIGSVVGFGASAIVSKRIPIHLAWNNLLLLLGIPTAINYVLSSLYITYTIGIPMTIVITYLILIRLKIVSRSDMIYVVQLLPYRISEALIKSFKKIEKVLGKFHY
jgi:O-antigen/teichoic acid export membrane protein